MVLFTNIAIGQRVEVLRAGRILPGVVRFKGFLNGIPGEWVGVELDHPVGKHDGMIGGRRYFKCPSGYGIFTPSSKIRFIKLKRCLYNRYKTLEPTFVDESLFASTGSAPPSPEACNDATEEVNPYSDYPHFPLSHLVSKSIPSATMRKQELQKAKNFSYYSTPIHVEYETHVDEFITSPSIPRTHMPHMVQKKRALQGWHREHFPRDLTVNTARESLFYKSWNHL